MRRSAPDSRFRGTSERLSKALAHARLGTPLLVAAQAHETLAYAGKVTRLVNYWDRQRALADLGLASEADSPNA